jgi:hypothetical protein
LSEAGSGSCVEAFKENVAAYLRPEPRDEPMEDKESSSDSEDVDLVPRRKAAKKKKKKAKKNPLRLALEKTVGGPGGPVSKLKQRQAKATSEVLELAQSLKAQLDDENALALKEAEQQVRTLTAQLAQRKKQSSAAPNASLASLGDASQALSAANTLAHLRPPPREEPTGSKLKQRQAMALELAQTLKAQLAVENALTLKETEEEVQTLKAQLAERKKQSNATASGSLASLGDAKPLGPGREAAK